MTMEALPNKHIEELWTVANDYCAFLENCRDYDPAEINEYLRKVIPLLYLKGSLIPRLEFDEDVIAERYVSEEHYENIFMAALQKYQKFDADSWSRAASSPEYVAEGLADIYQDLKDFTVLLRKPLSAEKRNAVAEVAASFPDHWGLRLAELMPVIHNMSDSGFEEHQDEDNLL